MTHSPCRARSIRDDRQRPPSRVCSSSPGTGTPESYRHTARPLRADVRPSEWGWNQCAPVNLTLKIENSDIGHLPDLHIPLTARKGGAGRIPVDTFGRVMVLEFEPASPDRLRFPVRFPYLFFHTTPAIRQSTGDSPQKCPPCFSKHRCSPLSYH